MRDVAVDFGPVAALRDVAFDVGRGESIGLVGPSGAGKTTLLGLINGMVRPMRGEVRTFGEDLATLPAKRLRRLRSRIGFVHQQLHLVPSLSVEQNVLMGGLGRASLAGALAWMLRPSKAQTAEVHRQLERVGIGNKLFTRVDRLSGGERQRVAIARALYQTPEILLADEPIASVDPARARSVLELLVRLAREDGITLCVSLHNVELARELLPRLVGLKAGRVVFDQATSAVGEADFGGLFTL